MPPKGKSTKHAAKDGRRGRKPRGLGEGTLILSYIRRLGPFLRVPILNFNIFGVFRKTNIFLGYDVIVDILSSQNWTIYWDYFYTF